LTAASDPHVAFRLTLPAEIEDLATACLWERGTAGIEVGSGGPGEIVLLAYFPTGAESAEGLREALADLPVRLEPVPVADVDWVARVREGFAPFDVPGFRIVPAWQSPGSGGMPVIRIDPGRAFGIGTHESTRLCLGALRALRDRQDLGRMLDLGTGTGILAIAAALSGATRVVGVDHDSDAIESARRHARLNDVDLGLVRGDLGACLAPGSFDFVAANLTAPLLLERRAEIAGLRSRRGILVLSGFLLEDMSALTQAYGPYGALHGTVDGEWASLQVLPAQ